jgi:hypothetical protein
VIVIEREIMAPTGRKKGKKKKKTLPSENWFSPRWILRARLTVCGNEWV